MKKLLFSLLVLLVACSTERSDPAAVVSIAPPPIPSMTHVCRSSYMDVYKYRDGPYVVYVVQGPNGAGGIAVAR